MECGRREWSGDSVIVADPRMVEQLCGTELSEKLQRLGLRIDDYYGH